MIKTNSITDVQFPSQKKSLLQKNDKWKVDCINAAERIAIYSESALRKSYINKKINYDLYSDIIQEEDIVRIANPYQLGIDYNPNKIQNYPLINPKIDLLVGEEAKRSFDWRLKITNAAPLIEKKLADFEEFKKFILELSKKEELSDEEIQAELTNFQKFMKFTKKDFREMYGTYIIKYLEQRENFKTKFNNGMKDALIAAEEIYQWEIISGEPKLLKLNPLNVHTVLSGESNHIEDSDIIVIDGYYSLGQIQDLYHDDLTEKEVKLLDTLLVERQSIGGTTTPDIMLNRDEILVEETLNKAASSTNLYINASPIDPEGNVRVLKVYWKTRRKMKVVTSYDNNGQELKKLMPEFYTPKHGETVKVIWINEWMEGHKICLPDNQAIYTRIKIKDVQYRNLQNPSICYPGIIGTIYTTNNQKAMSFMDKGKPYQYLYNVIMNNIENLIATNWGKILKIPLHEIPDGWDVDKWLSYAKTFKAVPTDLFKEGKKGAAIGKIAGGLQQNTPFLDMEVGNSLNTYIQLASIIEEKIGNVLGVTRAREGQISRSELVGNTERQVVQSSHITEYYFMEHDYLKARVMLAGLDTAKIAWEGKKHLEVIFDDFTSQLVELDMDQITSIEYDINIDSSFKTGKINNMIEQLAQAAFQNQMVDYVTFIDILQTDSIAEKKRKLELAQEALKEEQAKQAQQQQKAEEEAKQQAIQTQKDLIAFKEDKITEREKMKLDYEMYSNERDRDLDNDGIDDDLEIEKERVKGEYRLRELDKKLAFEKEENEKDRKLKQKEISIQEKKVNKENKRD